MSTRGNPYTDDESRRTYELACLEAVKRIWSGGPTAGRLTELQRKEYRGLAFVEAKLVGSYPDTRLVIVLDDRRTGLREAHGYELWGELLQDPPGSPGDPSWVAIITHTLLGEPSAPDHPDRGEVEILGPVSDS